MQDCQPNVVVETSESLVTLIGRISGLIAGEHFPNGDRAAFKRMDPKQEPPLCFYRFALRNLPPNWQSQLKAWQAILNGMALMLPKKHDLDQPFGKALAEATEKGYPEARLERLLAAEGETQRTLILRAVRFLAAKKQGADWTQIAGLLLTTDAERREKLHLRIASDYYKNLKDKE